MFVGGTSSQTFSPRQLGRNSSSLIMNSEETGKCSRKMVQTTDQLGLERLRKTSVPLNAAHP
jgi:hypothetical protein